MKIKVGIIFGGRSVEHEISIITALQAMDFLDRNKYDLVPIYISKEGLWYTGYELSKIEAFKDLDRIPGKEVCLIKKNNSFVLQKVKGIFKNVVDSVDVVIPIVHGKGVEDGSLAGYLEMLGIPYAAPSVLGASLGQDKVVQKQLLESVSINVPDYVWFYDEEYLEDGKKIIKEIEKLKYPVIVKPARLGSSIGIKIAKDVNELESAIEDAISYDNKIIVEKMIENVKEVDCAVLGSYNFQEVSLIGEVLNNHEFLTFEDKYIGDGKSKGKIKNVKSSSVNTGGFKIPASISKDLEREIKEISRKAFKVLNLRGVTRFDYLIDTKTKKVYLNEPNTIPGCMAFFFFKADGKSYTELLDDLITMSIKEYKDELKRTTLFESNVLATYNGSKGSKGKLS